MPNTSVDLDWFRTVSDKISSLIAEKDEKIHALEMIVRTEHSKYERAKRTVDDQDKQVNGLITARDRQATIIGEYMDTNERAVAVLEGLTMESRVDEILLAFGEVIRILRPDEVTQAPDNA